MLDRASDAMPLYAQVVRVLAAEISTGRCRPADQLPSEPALAKELGVSRATVTKAFDELQRDELIERRQGKGTFVLARPKQHSLADLTSFTTVTEATGAIPSQRLVSLESVPVGHLRDELTAAFPSSWELVVLERLRFSNDVAVGHHRVAVAADLLRRAGLSESDLHSEDLSLYRAFALIGQAPYSAEEWLRAVPCPTAVAELLDVAPGAVMMRVRRLSRNRGGELMEAVDAHYVGSLYEYHTQLSSTSSSNTAGGNLS